MRQRTSSTAVLALAAGLLGAAGASRAQVGGSGTSLALYGIADACLAVSDLGESRLKLLSSGCLYGSRLGLRGSEDLGGGMRAFFTLEGGFTLDNGALGQGGRLFGRKALLSLGGRWGSVELGRDYAPAFYLVQPVDPMGLGIGTASSTVWTGASSTTVARNDNVVNYLSPSWGDWTLRLQAAAGEGGNNNARKAMGLNLMYRSADTIAGITHTRVANAADTDDDQATTVAVRQEFGRFSVSAIVQSGAWKGSRTAAAPANAASLFSRDYRSYLIGGSVRTGTAGIVNASLKRYDDRTASDFDATQWSVNYVHSLSRRTDLYAGYSRLKNVRASRYEVSDATTSYTGVAPGATTSLLVAGIKHSF